MDEPVFKLSNLKYQCLARYFLLVSNEDTLKKTTSVDVSNIIQAGCPEKRTSYSPRGGGEIRSNLIYLGAQSGEAGIATQRK